MDLVSLLTNYFLRRLENIHFQNHPLGHLGGWATPWSAEKMLDFHQRVDILAHARTAQKGFSAEKTEKGSLLSCAPDDPIGQGTETN